VKRLSPAAVAIPAAFLAGFFTYFLYLRWSPHVPESGRALTGRNYEAAVGSWIAGGNHPVTYSPQAKAEQRIELPVLQARDVEKIRGLAGQRAMIRGRIFRVGHSAKSNTYFLNFGPSRESLTGVIFASAVELFEKNKLPPKAFEGKEVEVQGEIKDHPQYGLELILENPSQIRVVH
jgi:hypothetical protein